MLGVGEWKPAFYHHIVVLPEQDINGPVLTRWIIGRLLCSMPDAVGWREQ